VPSFPIIDTHVHLWDPRRLSYAWQKDKGLLDRAYRVEDYQRDSQGLQIEAFVFLECDADLRADSSQSIQEIEFVEEEARRDPRLLAIVPMAPLERGRAVASLLERMVAHFPKVRGVRRIIESAVDPGSLILSPRFIDGVNLLERFNLHFEITVNFTQMDFVLEFVKQIPNVPMILDHCGKPGVRAGRIETFRRHLSELAHHPNVVCKLSDLPVEADWTHWTEGDVRPFIDATIDAFGVDRVLYGGDWPVCLQATSLQRWVQVLDHALHGLSNPELQKIYRDNARRFYRLDRSHGTSVP
jgi:L-fuconolactonase